MSDATEYFMNARNSTTRSTEKRALLASGFGRTSVVLAVMMCVGGCHLESDTVVCESGVRCPAGASCTQDGTSCIFDRCGDGMVDANEVCDDGNIRDGDNCSRDCQSSLTCGNGTLNADETCDDGNNVSGDGCSFDCRSAEICGNDYVDFGEGCDDGNLEPGDGCTVTCQLESCGNGIIEPGEVCDDGGIVSGDGCSADCLSSEICGNGIVDLAVGEQCDAMWESDVCDGDCTFPVCGDGYTNKTAGEQCDDGNLTDGDGCSSMCTLELP